MKEELQKKRFDDMIGGNIKNAEEGAVVNS